MYTNYSFALLLVLTMIMGGPAKFNPGTIISGLEGINVWCHHYVSWKAVLQIHHSHHKQVPSYRGVHTGFLQHE